jgi:hypothetical protein
MSNFTRCSITARKSKKPKEMSRAMCGTVHVAGHEMDFIDLRRISALACFVVLRNSEYFLRSVGEPAEGSLPS